MSRRRDTQGRVVATVLFTDIVRSSEIATEMGDVRWREMLRRHHSLVRDELARFGGKEQDTTGDGFFATFPVPGDAIRCACSVSGRVRELGMEIRVGLHSGQLERAEGKASGIGVVTAARIMALATAGEVLVSSTLRELVAGERLGFESRGTRELKGVSGEWPIFAVTGVDGEPLELPLAWDDATKLREGIQPPPLLRKRGRVLLVAAAVLGAAALAVVLWPRHTLVVPGKSQLTALVEIDPATKQIINVGRYTSSLGATIAREPPLVVGEGRVWLGQGASLIRVIAQTGAVEAPILLDYFGAQDSLAVGFGKVWIGVNGLTTVDPATGQVHQPIPLPGIVSRIAAQVGSSVVAGHGGIWASTPDGVALVNGKTGKLVEQIPVVGTVDAIALGNGSVWVADKLGGTITEIDPKTRTSGTPILLSGSIDAIVVGGGYVWVMDTGGGIVTPIDPGNPSQRQAIRVGSDPVDITFGLGKVWVADRASGTIWKIDPVNKVAEPLIHVDGAAVAVAVDQADRALWVDVVPNEGRTT